MTVLYISVTGKRSQGVIYSTPAPRFQDTEENYTYHKGERAILYCSVKHLGTRKVRAIKTHIKLVSGLKSYIISLET